MKWKTLRMPPEMQGHKFFADPDGRIAIADWSGHYPHQTDDGVLWLDPSRAMTVWFQSGERVMVVIPLLNKRGGQTCTVSDIHTAAFAKRVGNMRVESDSADLRALVQLITEPVSV